jgi:spore germination protein
MMLALIIAAANTPKVTTWVVGYQPNSIKVFEQRAKQIDTAFTEFYTVDKNSQAVRRTQYGGMVSQARSICRKSGTQFFVMVNNYATDIAQEGFEATRMTKALASVESRKKLADQLTQMVIEDQAQGIDLDFESLVKGDRDRYSAFVAQLAKTLHAKKKLLSVTVHPKETVEGTWDGNMAQDYKALGSSADMFNIMTYDAHWSSSDPGAIAPNAWVERVMNFAKSQVEPRKLGMGIACYGYDWSQTPAVSLIWPDVANRKFQIDESSQELVDGKLYFGGAKSFANKYQMAKRLGVRSIAFWYCGSEEPEIWKFLERRN